MDELKKWQSVNRCKNLIELSSVIRKMDSGIDPEMRCFDAGIMSLENIHYLETGELDKMTTNYSIRQQAIYLASGTNLVRENLFGLPQDKNII